MRKQYKVPYHIREYVKKELYQYWDNKEGLKELEADIIEESPPPPDGQPRGNGTGQPTERKAIKLEQTISTKRMIKIQKNINAIEKAFKKLPDEEMEVVELIFKKGQNQIYTEMNNNISKDTYYNVMNKTIYITAIEMGEI